MDRCMYVKTHRLIEDQKKKMLSPCGKINGRKNGHNNSTERERERKRDRQID